MIRAALLSLALLALPMAGVAAKAVAEAPAVEAPSACDAKPTTAPAAEAAARDAAGVDPRAVYEFNAQRGPSLQGSFEVFKSTIEQEDYVMGALQQRTAESGQLKEVILGRNEPALHHFHRNYREALNQPPLVPVGALEGA